MVYNTPIFYIQHAEREVSLSPISMSFPKNSRRKIWTINLGPYFTRQALKKHLRESKYNEAAWCRSEHIWLQDWLRLADLHHTSTCRIATCSDLQLLDSQITKPSWDINSFTSLNFGQVTDIQTESDTYEATVHKHRCAQKTAQLIRPLAEGSFFVCFTRFSIQFSWSATLSAVSDIKILCTA